MLSAEHVRPVDRRALGRRVMVGTAGAVVGVSACFFVAALTGASLTVAVRGMSATSVPLGAAVVATATTGVVAYGLARLAGRASFPRRIFLLLTMAGLLASAVPPLQAANTVSTAIWLLVMHAVAALVLVPVVAGGLPSVRQVGESKVAPSAGTQTAGSAAVNGNL